MASIYSVQACKSCDCTRLLAYSLLCAPSTFASSDGLLFLLFLFLLLWIRFPCENGKTA